MLGPSFASREAPELNARREGPIGGRDAGRFASAFLASALLASCGGRPPAHTETPIVDLPAPTPAPASATRPLIVARDPLERGNDTSPVSREPCSQADQLRSLTSDTSLFLDFQNDSPGPVSIEWLDFNGRRVHYADLDVGQGYRQQTYVTHPWIALDADGGCRGVFVPHAAGVHAVRIVGR